MTGGQVVIAADINTDSPDFGHLEPMVSSAQAEFVQAGVTDAPSIVLADAGYWHQQQMEAITERGMQVLIPPDAGKRKGARPGWDGGLYAFMRRVLNTDQGGQTPGNDRAGVRPDQVQPPRGPLPTPRQSRVSLRMATHHGHS